MHLHGFPAAAWTVLWATRGSAAVSWATRSVRLDLDAYLVLDATERVDVRLLEAGTRLQRTDVRCVTDGAGTPLTADPSTRLLLLGHLQPMDSAAGLLVRDATQPDGPGIVVEVERRRADLARALLAVDGELRERARRIGGARSSTGDALMRRLLDATDYIESHFEEPLTLHEMAGAARLSSPHFGRLFRLVHGCTPRAYLLSRRAQVARRCLGEGTGAGEAATRAGFGSRSAMSRSLRRADLRSPAVTACRPSA